MKQWGKGEVQPQGEKESVRGHNFWPPIPEYSRITTPNIFRHCKTPYVPHTDDDPTTHLWIHLQNIPKPQLKTHSVDVKLHTSFHIVNDPIVQLQAHLCCNPHLPAKSISWTQTCRCTPRYLRVRLRDVTWHIPCPLSHNHQYSY